METAKMPREVVWALVALAVATVGGVVVALAFMVLQQRLGSTMASSRYIRLSSQTLLSIVYMTWLAKGNGWFRWLFVISMALMVVSLGFTLLAWLGNQGQVRLLMAFTMSAEVPLLLLRAFALVLLFRPAANLWFEQRAAARAARNEFSGAGRT